MSEHRETEAHRAGAIRGEHLLNMLGMVFNEDAVTDLVCDLLHATACHGADPEAVVTFAWRHYAAEALDPDDLMPIHSESGDAAEPDRPPLTLIQGGA